MMPRQWTPENNPPFYLQENGHSLAWEDWARLKLGARIPLGKLLQLGGALPGRGRGEKRKS